MGQGRAPNYRIEYLQNDPTVFAAYNGLSHKEIEDLGEWNLQVALGVVEGSDRTLRREHWSSRVMSFDDVSELLGRLRQRRR